MQNPQKATKPTPPTLHIFNIVHNFKGDKCFSNLSVQFLIEKGHFKLEK